VTANEALDLAFASLSRGKDECNIGLLDINTDHPGHAYCTDCAGRCPEQEAALRRAVRSIENCPAQDFSEDSLTYLISWEYLPSKAYKPGAPMRTLIRMARRFASARRKRDREQSEAEKAEARRVELDRRFAADLQRRTEQAQRRAKGVSRFAGIIAQQGIKP
jgi:hypothetical protein